MVLTNCAEGTLVPYTPAATNPWNEQRVTHLVRRLGFSARLSERTAMLTANPNTLIDAIVDAAIAAPLSSPPEWADWTYSDYSDFDTMREIQITEWLIQWQEDFFAHPLRGKLTLFWSNSGSLSTSLSPEGSSFDRDSTSVWINVTISPV